LNKTVIKGMIPEEEINAKQIEELPQACLLAYPAKAQIGINRS
jgi:hypothetical protein